MALADFAAYTTALSASPVVPFTQPSASVVAGRPNDSWLTMVPVGAFPTTAVVPTDATAGALPVGVGGSGALSLIGARFNATTQTTTVGGGLWLICDRLSHQGGLSGTTTGAQTTNLPTAALTRYTSGEGVMMGLSIANAVGTTGTTVTVSYTNTTPTSGRTSAAVAFGSTGFRESNRMILLPLQAGDTGVRAVASVTLAASTVSAAGNFGVVLFKPLYAILVDNSSGVVVADYVTGNTGGGIPEIVDNACLFALSVPHTTNNLGVGSLLVAEV